MIWTNHRTNWQYLCLPS